MDASRVRTLLLDLDGTLVGMRSTRTQVHFVFAMIRAWRNQIPAWTGVRALRAVGRAFEAADPEQTNAHRAIEAFSRVTRLSYETAAGRLMRTVEQVFPELKRYFFPVPGAQEFVRWAYEGYGLILATNPVWSREIIEYRVRWAGLDPALFRFISHAGVMHAVKPDPEYFREVLRLNGLKAEECVMIGNEVLMDQPAQKAGLPVFLLTPGIHPAIQREPGVWAGDFKALRELLEKDA